MTSTRSLEKYSFLSCLTKPNKKAYENKILAEPREEYCQDIMFYCKTKLKWMNRSSLSWVTAFLSPTTGPAADELLNTPDARLRRTMSKARALRSHGADPPVEAGRT